MTPQELDKKRKEILSRQLPVSLEEVKQQVQRLKEWSTTKNKKVRS